MGFSETSSSRGGLSDFSEDELGGPDLAPSLAPSSQSRTPPRTADLPLAVTCQGMGDDLFTRIKVISVQALNRHRIKRDVARHMKQELYKDADFRGLIGQGDWDVTIGEPFAYAGATKKATTKIAVFDIPTYQETVTIYKASAP